MHRSVQSEVSDDTSIHGSAGVMLARLRSHRLRLRQQAGSPATKRHGDLLRAAAAGDRDELAGLGIDARYAWLDDVVGALLTGSSFVEIETVGPYAAHHVDPQGRLDVRYANLTPSEQAGVMMGAMLRDVLRGRPNIRFVALVDDLNPDERGRTVPAGERDRYVQEIQRLLCHQGLLRPSDVLGRDFILLRESTQAQRVGDLVDRLRRCGRGVVETTDRGELVFRPTARFVQQLALVSANREREVARKGVVLTTEAGPTCQAIDAAGFLDGVNRDLVHLVVLDREYTAQQDKTYALVRAVDAVPQEGYHNVFYDAAERPPEIVALAMAELVADEVRRYVDTVGRFQPWNRFEPHEYVTRNYGSDILAGDREIVRFVADQLARADLPPAGVAQAVDVGTGPNLYPAMLVAPYLGDDASLTLVEPAAPNRRYLQDTLTASGDAVPPLWDAFEELMVDAGGDRYRGAFHRVRRLHRVAPGSVFDLPVDAYDVVTSFFVVESITTSRRAFLQAIRSLAGCVRPEGILVVGHMVGSQGWRAGAGTWFPAVRLSLADIEQAYREAHLDVVVHSVGPDGPDGPDGADGARTMAVAVARRPR